MQRERHKEEEVLLERTKQDDDKLWGCLLPGILISTLCIPLLLPLNLFSFGLSSQYYGITEGSASIASSHLTSAFQIFWLHWNERQSSQSPFPCCWKSL